MGSVGVTTGEAFCGVVGSKTRKEYTVLVSDVARNELRRVVGGFRMHYVPYLSSRWYTNVLGLLVLVIVYDRCSGPLSQPKELLEVSKM